MSFGGKHRNKAEQARIDALKSGECMACIQRGISVAGMGLVEARSVFGGDYEVTAHGQIRSLKTGRGNHGQRWMRQSLTPAGYLRVQLRISGRPKNWLVHRIVAMAFFGESDLQVNHMDGNKTNNCVENLEYVTRLENMAHARKHGLTIGNRARGEQHHAAKLTATRVAEMRAAAESRGDLTLRQVADDFGVPLSTLENVVYRTNWKHV